MASWVERLDARIEAAKRQKGQRRGGKHEDGQTCPRCGDLFSWRTLYCPTCKMMLK